MAFVSGGRRVSVSFPVWRAREGEAALAFRAPPAHPAIQSPSAKKRFIKRELFE